MKQKTFFYGLIFLSMAVIIGSYVIEADWYETAATVYFLILAVPLVVFAFLGLFHAIKNLFNRKG